MSNEFSFFFSEIRVVYDMMGGKTTAEPEAKEIVNHTRLIWFYADNEGKNTNLQSDLRADVRRSRKQANINPLAPELLFFFYFSTHCI